MSFENAPHFKDLVANVAWEGLDVTDTVNQR